MSTTSDQYFMSYVKKTTGEGSNSPPPQQEYDLIITKLPYLWPTYGQPYFCLQYYMSKNFVQILIFQIKQKLSNLSKIIHISDNIESTEKADHILRSQDNRKLVIIVSESYMSQIIFWFLKNQRRYSRCLPTFKFRGTPCILNILSWYKGKLIIIV